MTVSPIELTAIGACSGALEVCIMQPLVGIKNALQEGRPVPRNPVHLYRGLSMNVLSMAPITASQFGTNLAVQQLILGKAGGQLTNAQKFGSAAVAGAVSALIASPSELIIIHQQKSGRTLAQETRHFFSTYGVAPIVRGLTPAIGRETLYAAGYLGLFPILQDKLEPHLKDYPQGSAMVVAGLSAGIFAAVASHPFDTCKTRMQAFMYTKSEYLTLSKTMSTIVKEGGITRLWSGLSPRMLRIVAATFILNFTRTTAVDYLEKERATGVL